MGVLKPHGTTGRYRKGCRCDRCKEAQRAVWKAAREKRRKGPIPGDVHGTWNGYTNYGCKCELCLQACRAQYPSQKEWRDANREYLNEQRRRYYHDVVKPREAAEDKEKRSKRLK